MGCRQLRREEGFKDPVSNVRLATTRLCASFPVAIKFAKAKLEEHSKSDDPDLKLLAEKALKGA